MVCRDVTAKRQDTCPKFACPPTLSRYTLHPQFAASKVAPPPSTTRPVAPFPLPVPVSFPLPRSTPPASTASPRRLPPRPAPPHPVLRPRNVLFTTKKRSMTTSAATARKRRPSSLPWWPSGSGRRRRHLVSHCLRRRAGEPTHPRNALAPLRKGGRRPVRIHVLNFCSSPLIFVRL